jgi:peptidoglycan-associated lipoprotein
MEQIPINWVVIGCLAGVLMLGGCSQRSLVVTTSSAEAPKVEAEVKAEAGPAVPAVPERPKPREEAVAKAEPSAPVAPREPVVSEPLKGFEKVPAEEAVKPPVAAEAGVKAEAGPAVPAVPERPKPREEAVAKAEPSAPVAPREPVVSEPLKGFEKVPAEEAVKPPVAAEAVQPPEPQEVAKAQPQELVPGKVTEAAKRELLDVYFAFDRWSLSPEAKRNLARSAEALKQEPSARLLIEGHCDERGSREYNLVLGEKRAWETRRHLQALGVSNPVSVTSFGKERPVCTEQDEACYWKNRRAHLVIQESR